MPVIQFNKWGRGKKRVFPGMGTGTRQGINLPNFRHLESRHGHLRQKKTVNGASLSAANEGSPADQEPQCSCLVLSVPGSVEVLSTCHMHQGNASFVL